MIANFIALTLVAFVAPRILPGIKVRGLGAALAIALVFALLNLAVGWLLYPILVVLTLPLVLLTLGLFMVVVHTVVNALLLKVTDALLDSFELRGWTPAFAMGFLFAVAAWLAKFLSS